MRKFPLIGKDDIIKFDWKNQLILLTEEAKERIKKLSIPLEGLPVILTLMEKLFIRFGFGILNPLLVVIEFLPTLN
ncbi:MAG: hypothetical protein HRT67_05045 [Flavobacteriaceae bacterium]|nr:hypothetical protein [Flavobacteriaceae bacterium]